MSKPSSDFPLDTLSPSVDWRSLPPSESLYPQPFPRPSRKSLFLSFLLFLLTLCTCLAAGTQFAAAYAQNQAVSFDEFLRAFTFFYKSPSSLLAGLPFAATLLTILLAHELGHFFACRHHQIHSSYPFFIPFPSLIGTFGAFILLRSPIRTARALFDVGASGPFVGFVFAIPALLYGVVHSKFVPGLIDPTHAQVIFGTPLLLRFFARAIHPGLAPATLLLHPVGRAAWVGLFATSLNLLPAGQLDGGHILRAVNIRIHRLLSFVLPLFLLALGLFLHWTGWYIWAGLLFGLRFLRTAPLREFEPLDPSRKFGAFLALLVFLLCFMPDPLLILDNN